MTVSSMYAVNQKSKKKVVRYVSLGFCVVCLETLIMSSFRTNSEKTVDQGQFFNCFALIIFDIDIFHLQYAVHTAYTLYATASHMILRFYKLTYKCLIRTKLRDNFRLPFRIKKYTEFYLATRLRMVKFKG